MSARHCVEAWTRSPFMRVTEISRYSSWPVLHDESVAEHSHMVCLLATVMARDLQGKRYKVSLGKLLERAVCHDLDEAVTGDFIRSFKYSSAEIANALKEGAKIGMEKVAYDLPNGDTVQAAWLRAKHSDLEGQIVHLSDMWSVVIFCRREFLLGNQYARSILTDLVAWMRQEQWGVLGSYAEAIIGIADKVLCEPETLKARITGEMVDPFMRRFYENDKEGE